jgi:hypothetical protein
MDQPRGDPPIATCPTAPPCRAARATGAELGLFFARLGMKVTLVEAPRPAARARRAGPPGSRRREDRRARPREGRARAPSERPANRRSARCARDPLTRALATGRSPAGWSASASRSSASSPPRRPRHRTGTAVSSFSVQARRPQRPPERRERRRYRRDADLVGDHDRVQSRNAVSSCARTWGGTSSGSIRPSVSIVVRI